MKLSTPAFTSWSLNRWTIRKVPQIEFLSVCILSSFSSNTCWEYRLPQLLHHSCTWKFHDFLFLPSEHFLLYNLCILFMLLVLCSFYFLHIAYQGCWSCNRAVFSVIGVFCGCAMWRPCRSPGEARHDLALCLFSSATLSSLSALANMLRTQNGQGDLLGGLSQPSQP